MSEVSLPAPLERFDPVWAETVVGWLEGPEVQFRWSGHMLPFPARAGDLVALWVQTRASGLNRHHFQVRAGDTSAPVGYLELTVDPANRSGRLGRVLVNPAVRNRGIAARALTATCSWASEELELHRVDLEVAADNLAAIASYERAGFCVEGLLRDARYFAGSYRSMTAMSWLSPERTELR